MITVNKRLLWDRWVFDVRCLSTDEKPADVPNGTPCLEIDTGKKYLFDGDSKTWKEIDSAVVITPAAGVEF